MHRSVVRKTCMPPIFEYHSPMHEEKRSKTRVLLLELLLLTDIKETLWIVMTMKCVDHKSMQPFSVITNEMDMQLMRWTCS